MRPLAVSSVGYPHIRDDSFISRVSSRLPDRWDPLSWTKPPTGRILVLQGMPTAPRSPGYSLYTLIQQVHEWACGLCNGGDFG